MTSPYFGSSKQIVRTVSLGVRGTFAKLVSFANSDVSVKIIKKLMDRRRHPLQPRQLGWNPNTGKNDKIGTDGTIGTNKYKTS